MDGITSLQNAPFSYNVDAKALTRLTRVHFLHVLIEFTRKGTRTFNVSWSRRTCKQVKAIIMLANLFTEI